MKNKQITQRKTKILATLGPSSNTIKKIFEENNLKYTFCFANGGDQFKGAIPEDKICSELGIELTDGLGGKIQSSSWILKNK